MIKFLGGEEVVNSDDETHFSQNPTDCPQYAPGGDEFVKCRVTRDKRGLDVLGKFLFSTARNTSRVRGYGPYHMGARLKMANSTMKNKWAILRSETIA